MWRGGGEVMIQGEKEGRREGWEESSGGSGGEVDRGREGNESGREGRGGVKGGRRARKEGADERVRVNVVLRREKGKVERQVYREEAMEGGKEKRKWIRWKYERKGKEGWGRRGKGVVGCVASE